MEQSINIGRVDIQATFKELIEKSLFPKVAKAFRTYGDEILEDVDRNREFEQFTGNLMAGLTAGLYENGKATEALELDGEGRIAPVIQKGQTKWLRNPVEGRPRGVTGQVDIVSDYPEATAIETIKENKPKCGIGLTVATGSEYSEYIENVRKLDVLSDTVAQVKREGISRMQQIIGRI